MTVLPPFVSASVTELNSQGNTSTNSIDKTNPNSVASSMYPIHFVFSYFLSFFWYSWFWIFSKITEGRMCREKIRAFPKPVVFPNTVVFPKTVPTIICKISASPSDEMFLAKTGITWKYNRGRKYFAFNGLIFQILLFTKKITKNPVGMVI